MPTTPSLFTAENFTVDLAKVSIVAKRVLNPGYWIRVGGGESVAVADSVGEAVLAAWIAFQGKFNPNTQR